jgi:transcriptional regulator with PAS, ATPase and Fis domain
LENVIEYGIVVCKNSILGTEHLPDYLRPKETGPMKSISQEALKTAESTWEEMEKHMLYELLKRNHWNRRETANQMGVHPTTLWRKMKRLGLQPPPPHLDHATGE